MTAILQSGWATMLVGTVLYLGVTAMLLSPQRVLPPSTAETASQPDDLKAVPTTLPWGRYDPELDRLMTELMQEKQALALKKKQLADWEARLQAESAELSGVTQAVQRLQADFDKQVLRVQHEEAANLRKLAKIFAAMSAENAVELFRHFEDEEVVKILSYYKDTDVASLLETMAGMGQAESKRAARLSEMLKVTIKPDPSTPPAASSKPKSP